MPQYGKVDERVSAFVNITANVIKIISAILGLIPAITAIITQNVVMILLAVISFFFALVILFMRKKIARHLLYAFLSLTAPQKNYKLTKKEVIYEFLDRTHMRHEKNFHIKVLHPSFSGINDKYKWTGEAELTVEAKDKEHHYITLSGAKFGLNRYNINLIGEKRYTVGEQLVMGAVMENIEDPTKKSSLHLSSGIYERTDSLELKVIFDPNLQPQNARKMEFIHYNDDNHYWEEHIEPVLEGNKICLKWQIDKPLYGGKYMIEWEF